MGNRSLASSERDSLCFDCEKRKGRKAPWEGHIIYLCDECYWNFAQERQLQEQCEEAWEDHKENNR